MKWKNKGKEFENIAQKILNDSIEYYIWGAGTFGESFYEEFQDKIKIISFLDSNMEKQDNYLKGIKIEKPEVLMELKENAVVLISAGWTNEIFGQLNNWGYKKNKNYFHIDEFLSIYMMYKFGKLCFTNLAYVITQKCTLKCKHCVGFYPYYKNPTHIPIEKIEKDLDLYFKWVDSLNVLGLTGGDAMLHPDFNNILEKIGSKYYKSKIYNIEVYTNAIIVPKKETLELFKKYKVFYRFTDYKKNANDIQKIDEVIKLLDEYEIRYDKVVFDTWYDSGYPQESNGILEDKALVNFFDACNRRSCQGLKNGKVYYCDLARGADEIGYCDLLESDYYDLNNLNFLTRVEFMEYMLGYSEKGYFNYCKKCNGGQNINKKYVLPGEQL